MKKAVPLLAACSLAALCASCGRGADREQVLVLPGVAQDKLDAEELATILGGDLCLEVHKFSFFGGPVECWLEIQETGQKTMPARIPEGDKGLDSMTDSGTILVWWKKDLPDATHGTLRLSAGNNMYQCGIPEDALMLGWKNRHGGSSGTWQFGSPVKSPLMEAKYTEGKKDAKDPEHPREVSIALYVRFPEKGENQAKTGGKDHGP